MQKDMQNLLKELTEGMQRLCAVANRIVAQKGAASRIETDLLLDDLRKLYDVALQMGGDTLPEPKVEDKEEKRQTEDQRMMAMMSTIAAMTPAHREAVPPAPVAPAAAPVPEKAAPAPEPVAVEPEVVIAPEPVVEEPAPAPEPAPMPAMEELEGNDNALLFDEVIIEPEPEPAPEPVQTEAVKEPEPTAPGEVKNVQSSLLDYLQNPSQRTLGEQLAAQHPLQNSLERKVDDLRTVININDRFSFMSELFHNNIKAYNDFIMTINAAATRDEAMALVADMAAQQKWVEGSPTVATFYKLLDKKF